MGLFRKYVILWGWGGGGRVRRCLTKSHILTHGGRRVLEAPSRDSEANVNNNIGENKL